MFIDKIRFGMWIILSLVVAVSDFDYILLDERNVSNTVCPNNFQKSSVSQLLESGSRSKSVFRMEQFDNNKT